jgi:hypothetical protein
MNRSSIIRVFLAFFVTPAFGAQIDVYDDFSQFSTQFSTVELSSQDPANQGTTEDNVNWHLGVGGVEFEFEGPPIYILDFPADGINVLSKAVTVTMTPYNPTSTNGLGFYIYQYSTVNITVYDQDGDTYSIFDYSNNGGVSSSPFLGFKSDAGISKVEITGTEGAQITNIGQVAVASDATHGAGPAIVVKDFDCPGFIPNPDTDNGLPPVAAIFTTQTQGVAVVGKVGKISCHFEHEYPLTKATYAKDFVCTAPSPTTGEILVADKQLMLATPGGKALLQCQFGPSKGKPQSPQP